jgi:hypothetical protein
MDKVRDEKLHSSYSSQIVSNDQTMEDEMENANFMGGSNKKCKQNFSLNTQGGNATWETETQKLKQILQKSG